MKIFLSHSSKQKPLIREIRSKLPRHLDYWIDEENLMFGDELTPAIESCIAADADYVLLFVDEYGIHSPWIKKEIEWTLRSEQKNKRTILLPILIGDTKISDLNIEKLFDRKYLQLRDFSSGSVQGLTSQMSSELFALICREMDRLRNPEPKTILAKIADADSLLRIQTNLIRKTVFPHRKGNPIAKMKALEILNDHHEHTLSEGDFDGIVSSAIQRNMIPGLVYDGFELYLSEEHASWKGEMHHEKKEKIGRKAATYIENGMKIFFDAGSTCEEVIKILCQRIKNRAITNITLASTSINITDMISDCCVEMGFDDDFSAVSLFVPGGKIRPSTQAIVPAFEGNYDQICALGKNLDGFDLAFLGANGVELDHGFTTHQNPEAMNKRRIIDISERRIILCDSSKIDIVLDARFANFEDELNLLIDQDSSNSSLKKLIETHGDKIILA